MDAAHEPTSPPTDAAVKWGGLMSTGRGVNLLKPSESSETPLGTLATKSSDDNAGEYHWTQEALLPRIGLVMGVEGNRLRLHGVELQKGDVIRFLGSRNQNLWYVSGADGSTEYDLRVVGAPADYPLKDVSPGVAFELEGNIAD